jgi:trehalose 6-phosphate synthase
MRWDAMMAKLRAGTIQQWFADFVEALQETRIETVETEPLVAEPAAVWKLHSINTAARYH